MLIFGVIIPATVPQRSEILEGIVNYPVYHLHKYWLNFVSITHLSVVVFSCENKIQGYEWAIYYSKVAVYRIVITTFAVIVTYNYYLPHFVTETRRKDALLSLGASYL
jgi:hypothetical protein